MRASDAPLDFVRATALMPAGIMMSDDLDRLFRLAGATEPDDWNEHFDSVGLILQVPPTRENYWCTPLNCRTFARTGIDGTHFSLLDVGDGPRDRLPVVMTVPMSDSPNVVVGATLREFLALGCRQGYGMLDSLVHTPAAALRRLRSPAFDPEAEPDEIAHLRTLIDAFDLRPWLDVAQRLEALQLEHFHALRLSARAP